MPAWASYVLFTFMVLTTVLVLAALGAHVRPGTFVFRLAVVVSVAWLVFVLSDGGFDDLHRGVFIPFGVLPVPGFWALVWLRGTVPLKGIWWED